MSIFPDHLFYLANAGEACVDCSVAQTTPDVIVDYIGMHNLLAMGGLATAIVLALFSHWLLYNILRKVTADSESALWRKAAFNARGVVKLGLVVLALKLTLPWVQIPVKLSGFLSHLILIGLIAIVGRIAYLLLYTFSELLMSRHSMDVEDNLEARKIRTRLRVLRQAANLLIIFITLAAMLMTLPGARSIGVSLFASAGVAGIVVGLAARPVLSNLLAGLQIALTQPIRIDDAVVIEGEWGWIEEITPTYVVVRIWDLRRLIVPLSHVIEHPFQNWTRESAAIIGSVFWHTDYRVPVEKMRAKLLELLEASEHWDGKVQVLQVVESHRDTMELRALMSAKNSPTAWNLRCEIREKMIRWLQTECPDALPRQRAEVRVEQSATESTS